MIIGERLRVVRKRKNLSQADIEKKTGLLRCYISRVENGYTVPAVENLEKLAGANGSPTLSPVLWPPLRLDTGSDAERERKPCTQTCGRRSKKWRPEFLDLVAL